MSRSLIVIRGNADRQRISAWATLAPPGTRVTFQRTRRSLPQNARLWAMLTELARHLPWHGVKLKPDDWKLIFMDALRRESRMVPNLDGDGFVNLGRKSSDLSKEEMSDLIELIHKFGAEHGVKFLDDRGENNG